MLNEVGEEIDLEIEREKTYIRCSRRPRSTFSSSGCSRSTGNNRKENNSNHNHDHNQQQEKQNMVARNASEAEVKTVGGKMSIVLLNFLS